MKTLRKHQHYPLKAAEADRKAGQKVSYRVTTINWTYASDKKGVQQRDKVHRNEYVFTLKQLIDFIRDTLEFAEDVISIERETK